MSNEENTEARIGAVEWHDLTVDDAEAVSDFYAAVVGWEPSPVSMGDYNDFNMLLPGIDEPGAGVCHARGGNSGLPAQWLMYVRVADVGASISECESRGGTLVSGPVGMGNSRYCVIQDPEGAVMALFEPA